MGWAKRQKHDFVFCALAWTRTFLELGQVDQRAATSGQTIEQHQRQDSSAEQRKAMPQRSGIEASAALAALSADSKLQPPATSVDIAK